VNLTIKFELEARVELIRAREHYRNITPALGQEFSNAFKECLKDISDFPETFKDLGDNFRTSSISLLIPIAFLFTPSHIKNKINRIGKIGCVQAERCS
jgi:hypothetical protein